MQCLVSSASSNCFGSSELPAPFPSDLLRQHVSDHFLVDALFACGLVQTIQTHLGAIYSIKTHLTLPKTSL